MTGIRKRSPTNKEFKKNFQGLASTQVKKGHLNNQEKKASDNGLVEGTLIRVDRNKFYSNGWEVKVGKGKGATTYMCENLDNQIPAFTTTDNYLVFKGNVSVEISIDKQTKIYQITNIKSANKKPWVLYNETLLLSTDTNEKTKSSVQAAIEIGKEYINLKSDKVKITDNNNNEINLIESQNKINQLESENSDLKTKVSDLEEQQKSLLERIEIIEKNESDENEEDDGT